MHGQNKVICIAGKNQCAIDALKYVIKKFKKKYKILALPNLNDNGANGWQKSFKKYCENNKVQITRLKSLYRIKNLYFFSLEFENILKVKKFKSKKLFNIHFSILPKFRGCHTNYYQILKGERISGVTFHIIDKGIDTGNIIDVAKFKINKNDTAYENYLKLLNKSTYIFKKNIRKVLENKFKLKKQNHKNGSYYGRKSVDYKKLINITRLEHNLKTHNKIRSLIFPPFQLPIYNGKKIKKSIYRNKKIHLIT